MISRFNIRSEKSSLSGDDNHLHGTCKEIVDFDTDVYDDHLNTIEWYGGSTNPPHFWQRVVRAVYWRRESWPFSILYPTVAMKRPWVLANGGRLHLDNPLEFMQRACISSGCYEPEIESLISMIVSENNVFWDVGANIGIHSIVAASLGCRVFSFEPMPHVYQRLQRNLALNCFADRVATFGIALGERNHQTSMYRSEREDDGSHSIIAPVSEVWSEVNINVSTGDTLVADGIIMRPDLVKIDVEGYEAKVLDGMQEVIHGDPQPFFIIESGDRLAVDIGENAGSVLHRMYRAGYSVYRVSKYREPYVLEQVSLNRIGGASCNYLCCPESRWESFLEVLASHQSMHSNS